MRRGWEGVVVIKNVGQQERRVMVLNFFELAIEYRNFSTS